MEKSVVNQYSFVIARWMISSIVKIGRSRTVAVILASVWLLLPEFSVAMDSHIITPRSWRCNADWRQ
jgi:hypothetical protein